MLAFQFAIKILVIERRLYTWIKVVFPLPAIPMTRTHIGDFPVSKLISTLSDSIGYWVSDFPADNKYIN